MGLLFSRLWSRLFGLAEFKICIVGLDGAGKTTTLYKLHLGEVVSTQPTIGGNVEEVKHNNITLQCWDLGGQESLRKSWSVYYTNTHAIVLVIDSTDVKRMPIVKKELDLILNHDDLKDAILLVLANKQDQKTA